MPEDRVEITAVVGNPWYVEDQLDDGKRKVALLVMVKGNDLPTVLVMKETTVEHLAHTLTHGQLPAGVEPWAGTGTP